LVGYYSTVLHKVKFVYTQASATNKIHVYEIYNEVLCDVVHFTLLCVQL